MKIFSPFHTNENEKQAQNIHTKVENFLYEKIILPPTYPNVTILHLNKVTERSDHLVKKLALLILSDNEGLEEVFLDSDVQIYEIYEGSVVIKVTKAELIEILTSVDAAELFALSYLIPQQRLHHWMCHSDHIARLALAHEEQHYTKHFSIIQWAELIENYINEKEDAILGLIGTHPNFSKLSESITAEEAAECLSLINNTSSLEQRIELLTSKFGDGDDEKVMRPTPQEEGLIKLCSFIQKTRELIQKQHQVIDDAPPDTITDGLDAFLKQCQTEDKPVTYRKYDTQSTFNALIETLKKTATWDLSTALQHVMNEEHIIQYCVHHPDGFNSLMLLDPECANWMYRSRWPHYYNRPFMHEEHFQESPKSLLRHFYKGRLLDDDEVQQEVCLAEGRLNFNIILNETDINHSIELIIASCRDEKSSRKLEQTPEKNTTKNQISTGNKVLPKLNLFLPRLIRADNIAECLTPHQVNDLSLFLLSHGQTTFTCLLQARQKGAFHLILLQPGPETKEKQKRFLDVKNVLRTYLCKLSGNKNVEVSFECIHHAQGHGANHEVIALQNYQDILSGLSSKPLDQSNPILFNFIENKGGFFKKSTVDVDITLEPARLSIRDLNADELAQKRLVKAVRKAQRVAAQTLLSKLKNKYGIESIEARSTHQSKPIKVVEQSEQNIVNTLIQDNPHVQYIAALYYQEWLASGDTSDSESFDDDNDPDVPDFAADYDDNPIIVAMIDVIRQSRCLSNDTHSERIQNEWFKDTLLKMAQSLFNTLQKANTGKKKSSEAPFHRWLRIPKRVAVDEVNTPQQSGSHSATPGAYQTPMKSSLSSPMTPNGEQSLVKTPYRGALFSTPRRALYRRQTSPMKTPRGRATSPKKPSTDNVATEPTSNPMQEVTNKPIEKTALVSAISEAIAFHNTASPKVNDSSQLKSLQVSLLKDQRNQFPSDEPVVVDIVKALLTHAVSEIERTQDDADHHKLYTPLAEIMNISDRDRQFRYVGIAISDSGSSRRSSPPATLTRQTSEPAELQRRKSGPGDRKKVIGTKSHGAGTPRRNSHASSYTEPRVVERASTYRLSGTWEEALQQLLDEAKTRWPNDDFSGIAIPQKTITMTAQ